MAASSGASPAGPVVARFRLTASEYGQGMRAIMRRQPTMWGAPVAGVATLAAGLALAEPMALVLGLVALGIAGASFYVAPALRWKQNLRMGAEQEHTFSGTGISVRAGKERGHLPWGFYSRATETRNVYVLLRNSKQGNFVPKKAFGSPEDEARFRVLVADHLRTRWRT